MAEEVKEQPQVQQITKIRSICIDTLTAIQEHQFMLDTRKPNHDK